MLLSRVRVIGHSMEPGIKNGQIVLVSSIPFFIWEPRVYDIVLFRNKEKNFIKRIQKEEQKKYYLTGDNKNDSLDSRNLGWVDRDQILGKVIFIK
jgi:phage repressor protein C with HTH and peptisase S24 domain